MAVLETLRWGVFDKPFGYICINNRGIQSSLLYHKYGDEDKEMNPEDIVGKVFNWLTVSRYCGSTKGKHFYECSCRCGKVTNVERHKIISSNTKSCGCLKSKMIDTTDILGKKFEDLKVLSFSRYDKKGRKYYYKCICSCGNNCEVNRNSIITGHIKSCGCRRPKIKNPDDILGKTFGNLKVESRLLKHHGRKYRRYYNCFCVCGSKLPVERHDLLNRHVTSCGCANHKKLSDNPYWKGHGKISGVYWARVLREAKKREIKVEITIKQAWNQYENQNGKCALTGIDIEVSAKSRCQKDRTASLDRIDNNKGYELGNIQWLHKDINWMKGTFDTKRFIELCKLVSGHTNDRT